MPAHIFTLLLMASAILNGAKIAYTNTEYPVSRNILVLATGADVAAVIAALPLGCGYSAAALGITVNCNLAYVGFLGTLTNSLGYTVIGATFQGIAPDPLSPLMLGSSPMGALQISSSGSWQATSSATWLNLTGSNGTGNGTISYNYSANNSALPRTATITISVSSGSAQLILTQPGATPVYTFASTSALVGVQAGTGNLALSATMDAKWTATCNPAWLTISPTAGVGSENISYVYTANGSNSPRTGIIAVGGASFTLTQQAGMVTLTPSSVMVPQSGGSGGIGLLTNPANDPWTALSSAAWLTVTPMGGIGNATLTYSLEANNAFSSRTGTISVNGVLFDVNQPGISVTFSPSTVTVGGAGGTGTAALILSIVSASWTASSSASWLSISPSVGVGNTTLTYTATANNSVLARSASIIVNGTTLLVNQAGSPGRIAISPVSVTVLPGPSSGSIAVTPIPQDYTGWIVTGAPNWLTLSFSGNLVIWSAAANSSGLNRLANLIIGGQTFTLIQTAAGATNPVISGVTSAGSYAVGPVSPGEIVAIFGVVLGPDVPSGLLLTGNGTIATANSETQVFFDAIPAPILATYARQTSVQVPYSFAGKTSTNLTVQYKGIVSAPVLLSVAEAAFGLFTVDSSGSGQGAVLNEDLTLNALSNPAARGSVVVLFGTGEGQTSPPGVAGTLSGLLPPWLIPVQSVSVTIGGQPAAVEFAGEAPGEVSGLAQINVRVPQSSPPGVSVPVVVTIGKSSSQAVTIAVK